MDADAVREFTVQFAEKLVALFFLDQIIEVSITEPAEQAVVHAAQGLTVWILGAVRWQARQGTKCATGFRRHEVNTRVTDTRETALGVHRVGLSGKVAITHAEFASSLVTERRNPVKITKLRSENGTKFLVAITVGDVLMRRRKLQSLEIFARQEVHHTWDSVGTVGCRCTLFEHFNAFNSHSRECVNVHKSTTG